MHTVELCDWTRHGTIMYMGRTVFKEVSFRPGLLLLHTQVNIDQLRSVKISQDKILLLGTKSSIPYHLLLFLAASGIFLSLSHAPSVVGLYDTIRSSTSCHVPHHASFTDILLGNCATM